MLTYDENPCPKPYVIIDKASRNLSETIQQNTPDRLKSIIHGVLGVKLSDELAIEVIVVNYVIDDDPANYETETAKWSKLDNIKTSCHSGNSLLGPEVYLYLINSMRNITISPESFQLGPFQVRRNSNPPNGSMGRHGS